jgi:hypothetical protein
MGSSPYAKLAWGIDFGDPENTAEGFDWEESGIDSYDYEQEAMPELFGFTEEPPGLPDGWQETMDADARKQWRETVREPWEQRRDVAIPLTFEHYGYEFGGTALVLKRSYASVEWGCDPIDPASIAEPTAEELAAFAKVLTDIGHADGGPPKLLLMSQYG